MVKEIKTNFNTEQYTSIVLLDSTFQKFGGCKQLILLPFSDYFIIFFNIWEGQQSNPNNNEFEDIHGLV